MEVIIILDDQDKPCKMANDQIILDALADNDFTHITFTANYIKYSKWEMQTHRYYDAPVNEICANGCTFLTWTLRKSNFGTITRLLINGADANKREQGGATPLLIAIYLNRCDVAQFLVQNGADLTLGDPYGSPLIAAVRENRLRIIKLLLKHGADCSKDLAGLPPLFLAIKKNKSSIVAFFLSKNLQEVDSCGNTPLVAAIRWKSSVKILKTLLKFVDANTGNEKVPLVWAAEVGNIDAVKLLLEAGADVNLVTEYGNTALAEAVKNRQKEVVECLIANDANVCKSGFNGKTPLFWAVKNQDLDMINYLLDHGSDYIMDSVYLDAIETRNLDVIKLFHHRSTNLFPNQTILLRSIETGDVEVTRYLLENGSTGLESLPNQGFPLIIDLLHLGFTEMVKLLVENAFSLSLNQPTPDGFTLLTKSLDCQNVGVAKHLVAQGVSVNQTDRNGWTPLTKAIDVGNFEMVKFLVAEGADVDLVNGFGMNPLQLAGFRNDFMAFQYLVDFLATMGENEDARLAAFYKMAQEKRVKGVKRGREI